MNNNRTKNFRTDLTEKEFREVEAAIKKSKLSRHDWVVSCIKKAHCQEQPSTDEMLSAAKEKEIKEQEAILEEYKISILKAQEVLKKLNEKQALNYFALCKEAIQSGDTSTAKEYCKQIIDLLSIQDVSSDVKEDSFDAFLAESQG